MIFLDDLLLLAASFSERTGSLVFRASFLEAQPTSGESADALSSDVTTIPPYALLQRRNSYAELVNNPVAKVR